MQNPCMDAQQIMSATLSATRLTLPPIPLSELSEETKDFILAQSNKDDVPPMTTIKNVLNSAATKAGFPPRRARA